MRLLVVENQLSRQQIEKLISLLQKNQAGEKHMWEWIKKWLARSPVTYKVDLESVYQMAGV